MCFDSVEMKSTIKIFYKWLVYSLCMKHTVNKTREFRVLRGMNANNAISLLAPSANRVFQVVEYEDNTLREELANLDPGKLVQLNLDRIGSRANVWKANWPGNNSSVSS